MSPKGAVLKFKLTKEYETDEGRMLAKGIFYFDKLRPYITKREKNSWVYGEQNSDYDSFNRYIRVLFPGKYAELDEVGRGDRARFLNGPHYVGVDRLTEEAFNALYPDNGTPYYYPRPYSEVNYEVGIAQGFLWIDQKLNPKSYEVYGIPLSKNGLKPVQFHISVRKEHRGKDVGTDLLRAAAEDNTGKYSSLVCLWYELDRERSVTNVNFFGKMKNEGWQIPKSGIAFKLLE